MLDQISTVFTKYAAKLAFCIGTQSYTYGEWLRYVCGIQKMLQEKRPEGGFIGLAAFDDIETYAAILALWTEGYAFVPLSPLSPAERNLNVMKQVESHYILSSRPANAELVGDSDMNYLQTTGLQSEGDSPNFSKIDVNQILCMLFTSGSTGIPKGVPMTENNISTTLTAFFEEGYEVSAQDRFLQMFDLTFDMSMFSYLPAWCIGASVHTVSSEGIKYLNAFKIMQEQEVTFVTTVPSTLQLLRPYFSQINLPAVRYSFQGGEPFYADLAEAWMSCVPNATVVNLSGPCETTMACMSYTLNRDFTKNKNHKNILAFGSPWKETTVLLLNEQGEDCALGEEGELCFAGGHVMAGYWNMPEKNNIVFFERKVAGEVTRFYRTGDLSFQDKEGIYYAIGRKDIQYKIQGYKVELGDIEQHVRFFLKEGNAIAHVDRNEKGLLEIHIFIDKLNADLDALRNYLRKQLPNYMQPSGIRVLEKIPLTTSGKLDRKAIVAIFDGDDFSFITKAEKAERITDNLFSTYKVVAELMKEPVWKKGNLEAVDLSPSPWPKTAFGYPNPTEVEILAKAMLEKNIPSRVILERPLHPEVLYHKLGNTGFQHLVTWPGMAIDLLNNDFTQNKNGSLLLKSEEQLQQWFSILNEVFFVDQKLSWSLIKTIWQSPDFLFYGLSIKEEIVAIALGFRKNNALGIYMMVVKEKHRRKGYGITLMQQMLGESKAAGCRAAYLQSTPMGLGMYQKLGFEELCHYDIFSLKVDKKD